jgi:hypothetical protein
MLINKELSTFTLTVTRCIGHSNITPISFQTKKKDDGS